MKKYLFRFSTVGVILGFCLCVLFYNFSSYFSSSFNKYKCRNDKSSFTSNAIIDKEYFKHSILLDSKEGKRRFEQSQYKDDFFRLASFYSPQQHSLECGIATARIILNALYNNINKEKPYHEDRSFFSKKRNIALPYNLITDDDVLRGQNFSRDDVRGNGKNCDKNIGIDIQQYPDIFKSHGMYAKYYTMYNNSIQNSKRQLINAIKASSLNSGYFVIGFFSYHISPIVAYDDKSDSILIMDVEQHMKKWHWIDVDFVIKSMTGEKFHGFVVASNKKI